MKKVEDAVRQLMNALEATGTNYAKVEIVRTQTCNHSPGVSVLLRMEAAEGRRNALHVEGSGATLESCFNAIRVNARDSVDSGDRARQLLGASADTKETP